MSGHKLSSLDREVIESVLQMGDGYVLDFSDRTFAAFFAEHGVSIDDERYRSNGSSKAKRLRSFLGIAEPEQIGRVLGDLLERRLLKAPDGVKPQELERYTSILARFGVERPRASPAASPEADLLRSVFRPELFARLPGEPAMGAALVSRMEEAHRCIEAEAYLSAVILCGSVLEGMCLGFGLQHPERVNRAFGAQYNRTVPQFHEWKLREWIDVLARLGDLSRNVSEFGHALRDFRNYVHPAEQLANRFSPDRRTALIGFHVVVAALEDLIRADDRETRSAR